MTSTDYPDWLNPMLVKELRQGLSARVFTTVFVLVQVVMIVLMGGRLLTSGYEGSEMLGGFMDGLLWGLLGILLLFMMPLRGLVAIQEEKKVNTLELVQMTWLSSARIVWGKWIAIFTLTLLLTTAVLPYAVLRYFFGGMDIVDGLETLAKMLLGSMTLTAACVWLSTTGAAGRGTGGFVIVMGIQMFGGMRLFMFSGLVGSSSMTGTMSLPVMLFGSVATTVFVLAMAASRIGSPAENNASVLRGLALVVGGIACCASLTGNSAWLVVVMPVLFVAMLGALTERTSEVPSMYVPWMKWGVLGKLACRVLNPGWATGLSFTLIIVAMLAAASILANAGKVDEFTLISHALLYLALVTPVCVLALMPGAKRRGLIYVGVHLLLGLVFVAGSMVGATTYRGVNMVLSAKIDPSIPARIDAATPTSAAIWAWSHGTELKDWHWYYFTKLTLPLGGLIMAFLLFQARKEFALMRKQELRATPAVKTP